MGAGARSRHQKSLTPRGAPSRLLLTNFLLPPPTRRQDAGCFFLNKAELEAKLESLKEEVGFLRTFYEEVRGRPGAPAIISPPSWILKLLVPGDGAAGVTRGSGGDTGQQSLRAVFSSPRGPYKAGQSCTTRSQQLGAGAASPTSSPPCPHQESRQLRANASEPLVVVQMDNSRDLDLGGVAADVRAQYEDIARRSRAEAQAWHERKVRKPSIERGWCSLLPSNQLQTDRTPPLS